MTIASLAMPIKVSIITAVYNREATIEATIESVLQQSYPNIEYILVDGNSSDGTSAVIEKYRSRIQQAICEPDAGIYDAMNKGIRLATGDVVGFLHADDVLDSSDCIEKIAQPFHDDRVPAVYGDLVYVEHDNIDRVVRYWKSGAFDARLFRWGWMPPHPTVYIRRECYTRFGGYRQDMHISADYELLLRMFYAHGLQPAYLDKVLVRMRLGGKSNASLSNRLLANREDRKAWEVNGMNSPWALQLFKPLRKLRQYLARPPRTGR